MWEKYNEWRGFEKDISMLPEKEAKAFFLIEDIKRAKEESEKP